MSEVVPVHMVKYQDPTEVEVDDNHTVTNHDELDKRYVVRGMTRDAVEGTGIEHEIIEEDDVMWRDSYADIEVGEEVDILVE